MDHHQRCNRLLAVAGQVTKLVQKLEEEIRASDRDKHDPKGNLIGRGDEAQFKEAVKTFLEEMEYPMECIEEGGTDVRSPP